MISVPGKKAALCAFGGVLLLIQMAAPGRATPVTVDCRPTHLKVVSSSLDMSTRTAATFGNVPEAGVSFTVSGTSPVCVVVTFTARVRGSGVPAFRAFRNNAIAGVPAEMPSSAQMHNGSFVFVFPSVPPGSHVVRIQYRNIESGGGTIVDRPTTAVSW